jgi:ferritin-like metal-binding protein YciE
VAAKVDDKSVLGAKDLDRNDVVGLLNATLEEEKVTDKKSTTMAEAKVNRRAA